MKLSFLNCELKIGSKYLTTELRDSNDILDSAFATGPRMEGHGYLLICRLHDKAQLLVARLTPPQINWIANRGWQTLDRLKRPFPL